MNRKHKRPKDNLLGIRSETVTIRLRPELRRSANICAHMTYRTLSSFIEFAMADFVSRVDPAKFKEEEKRYEEFLKDHGK